MPKIINILVSLVIIIINLSFFSELFVQAQFQPIRTIPNLPDNILAFNYAGLQLSTQIPIVSSSYSVCNWVVNNNRGSSHPQLFYSRILTPYCANRTVDDSVQWDISCMNANGLISTGLKINNPLEAGAWNFEAQCYVTAGSERPDESVSIEINVKGLREFNVQ